MARSMEYLSSPIVYTFIVQLIALTVACSSYHGSGAVSSILSKMLLQQTKDVNQLCIGRKHDVSERLRPLRPSAFTMS